MGRTEHERQRVFVRVMISKAPPKGSPSAGMRGLDVFRTPDALRRAFGPEYFGFDDIT